MPSHFTACKTRTAPSNQVGQIKYGKWLAERQYITRTSLYWTIFFLLSPQALFSQAFLQKAKFQRFEVSSGLSSSHVTSILQDYRGYLWVGTNNGLNRYDGYEFKVYSHEEKDSSSLLTNRVEFLYEDSHHRLWVSTRSGGLHYYDLRQDKFIRRTPFFKRQLYH